MPVPIAKDLNPLPLVFETNALPIELACGHYVVTVSEKFTCRRVVVLFCLQF